MAKTDETQQLLRYLIEAFEQSDPAGWKTLIMRVLRADPQAPHAENAIVQQMIHTYLDLYAAWKQCLAQSALPIGYAFGRHFWIEAALADDVMAKTFAVELMSELLRELVKQPFTQAETLNDAGFALHFAGGYERALPLHEEAIGLSHDFALAWINKGIALRNLNRFDDAIECYDHVINKIDQDYKKAWHNKGVALKMKGELHAAVECFDQAISLDPGFEIALRVREQCLNKIQLDKPEGIAFLAKNKKLNRKFEKNPQAVGFLEMAIQLKARGNCVGAACLFDKICTLIPHDPVLLVCAGDAWYEAGQKDNAMNRFDQALDLDPTNGGAWISKARYYLERKNPAKALEMADHAVMHASHHSMTWANRASALWALERYTEGVESGQRAVKLDDHNPYGLYYLATCLWCLHRDEEARTTFERLLHVRPDCQHLVESANKILELLPRQSDTWGASDGKFCPEESTMKDEWHKLGKSKSHIIPIGSEVKTNIQEKTQKMRRVRAICQWKVRVDNPYYSDQAMLLARATAERMGDKASMYRALSTCRDGMKLITIGKTREEAIANAVQMIKVRTGYGDDDLKIEITGNGGNQTIKKPWWKFW